MRIVVLLLPLVLLAGGEPLADLPMDPAHAPLPDLRLSLHGGGRHQLGTAVWLQLVITAGSRPLHMLAEASGTPLDITLTAPDGTLAHEPASPRMGWDGVAHLAPGASMVIPVQSRVDTLPTQPGRHHVTVFLDLGLGPERPGDPRRVETEVEWVLAPPAEIPGIIQAQFAASDTEAHGVQVPHADLNALARPEFANELLRRARGGSHRALRLLGETPGPVAADGLLTLAAALPERWNDLPQGQPANIAFNLFSRIADHLPPRKLAHERAWWEDSACVWRRTTMTGVPATFLPRARAAALPMIGREDWGVAEVLTWSALPEDRPVLLDAIAKLATRDPQPSNNLHTMWQYAYAALLAAPDAAPPDPAAGVAEAVLWACHRRNAGLPLDAVSEARNRALLRSSDPLLRRVGVWALPQPIPEVLVSDLVPLLSPVATTDLPVTEAIIRMAEGSTDQRLLDGLLAAAKDARLYNNDDLTRILVMAGRRVELATIVAARCKADGSHGDTDFRTFSRLCLSVRPIFIYGTEHSTMPTIMQWQAAAQLWEAWLSVYGPAIRRDGPIPAGDARQPNYLLWPNYWFEADDSRRFVRPGSTL
jgi:hypothetical protein